MDLQTIKYPIYIISKGRFKNPITAKQFLKENIPFYIAVEPQEYNSYCKTIPSKFVLKLPFSNLGLGSYPARNYCWEHSIENGFDKHHLFDDNIYGFYILNNNKRTKATCKEAILTLEKLDSFYKNVAISGFNYNMFGCNIVKPFRVNVHIYSAMLITNDLPYRWRLKYNEDVDLCLQVLHNGYCTIQLNVYLACKVSTVAKLKGGNQTELYQNNNHNKKLLKAKSLEALWPQYVKTIIRFGRPHHQVSWKKLFKHGLIKKVTNDKASPTNNKQ